MEQIRRRPDVRNFSMEHNQEGREQMATELREKRKKYFERKQQIHDAIQELLEQIKQKELNIEQVVEEIEGYGKNISNIESSVIQRFLKFFEIKRIQESLREKEQQREGLLEVYGKMKELLVELYQQRENRHELDEAKERLDEFYHGENERLQEYQEEEKVRNVEEIIRKHNVYFLHGIHPKFVPLYNSMLTREVDWQTKLKILLSLEPSLSTSTTQAGDTHGNIWSRMGVVLNGGRIAAAHHSDAGTQATSLNNRVGLVDKRDIASDIDSAILDRVTYNEFVLERPGVSGFFVCTENIGGEKNDLVDFSEIYSGTQKLGMPLFVLEYGEMYEAEYDNESNILIKGKKISPEEMLGITYNISGEERNELVDEILTDSPFKIESPEVSYVDSRSTGNQTYIEIVQPRSGKEVIYYQDKQCVGQVCFQQGDSVVLLSEVESPSVLIRYFLQNDKIIREQAYKGRDYVNIDVIGRQEYQQNINVGLYSVDLGRKLNTLDDYLDGMRVVLLLLQKEIEEDPDNPFREKLLGMYAFHIYGFGEEARKQGDEETAIKAFSFASEFFPQEKYNEIISRRLDDKGRFRITKEEIE
ncbi:hypothetical protein KKG22_00495 [Patescibacteria group bacterium]|nr:hypothetical protein [Patescibacteria group bacterium]MBU1722153.1 hypothetical protein [Patescibacteria group bacterium]MBU1901202.1 hypothetical protein [Patescibacteria group bacterium]